MISTLDRLGRSTASMLDLAKAFRERGIGLRARIWVGGGNGSPTARSITPDAGQPATHVARDMGMSRATLYRRIAGIEAQDWIATQG